MGKNKKYLLDNVNFEIPICFWIMYLDNFLGTEKAEEFYEYLINARDIKRLNDIRNLISCIGFSVYDLSYNEQLAFISIFKPFDTESKLVKNMKNGVNDIFKYYKNKNLKLLEDIKDTTIDTVENYLSRISKTKVVFDIPFEKNKTVINKEVNYLAMKNYYSPRKQEKVKNKKPYSFNSAMLRGALLSRYDNFNA